MTTIIMMPGADEVLTADDIHSIAERFGSDQTVIVSSPVSDTGHTPTDLAEMWAESVIDHARFGDDTDRVLGRYENGLDLFPSATELAGMGVDIIKLALALDSGALSPANVLRALSGFCAN